MDTRKTVSLQEAKAHLVDLVDEANNGVEISITKRGKVVATLRGSVNRAAPMAPPGEQRRLGALALHGSKIDMKTWWREWKKADKEMERAFEKSLNQS